MSLQHLRSIAGRVDDAEIEELIYLASLARHLSAEYDERGIEAPEWLSDTRSAIDRQVSYKRRDALIKEKKEVEARLEALASPTQKRTALEAKLKRLQKELV